MGFESDVMSILSDIRSGVVSSAVVLGNQNILNNGRLSQQFNIPIPYTQTSPSLTPIFNFTADKKGDILYSLAMNYDTSNTQPNYSFLLVVNGLVIDNGTPNQNNYSLFPKSGGYNPIPEGIGIKLYPNSKIQLFAYNSGSATSNGEISVSLIMEQL
jgi:hypothetical protein